jgi:hypothetical protein
MEMFLMAITQQEIEAAQQLWAEGVIAIGQAYVAKEDYLAKAADFLGHLYAYDQNNGKVLFKPTLAREKPFRSSKEGAFSYFIANNPTFSEDLGFALNAWKSIVFFNDEVFNYQDLALVMGYYIFTGKDQQSIRVEYTFGYIRDEHQVLRIVLHHSSLPYSG